MSDSFIFTGKTTQEAVENGLKELNVTAEEVKITVLEEAKRGIFGLGAKEAKIQIVYKEKNQDQELSDKEEYKQEETQEIEEADFSEDVTDPNLLKVKNFLFDFMGFEVQIKIAETKENIQIKLISDNSADIIGYRGEVLNSLQTLAGAVANKGKGKDENKRVVVDCEGYRDKREDTLKALAVRLADKAVAKGRKIKLEPMSPFERRVIHSALAERTDVKTESEGKDPIRYVVIIPENIKKFGGRKGNERNHGYADKQRNSGYRSSGYNSAPRPKRSGFGATFLGNSFRIDNTDKND